MQFRSNKKPEFKKCIEQMPLPPFGCEYSRYIQAYRTQEEMHYHNYPEFGICLAGNGIFFVRDRIYPFSAGCVTYFPAGMLHIAQSPADHKSTWLYLWQDMEHHNIILPAQEIITYDKDCAALTEILYRCAKRADALETDYYNSLFDTLIRRLQLCETGSDSISEVAAREKILPAIRMIAEQYTEELPVSHLALACGMSESVFRRVFRQAIGQSPANYLVSVRILMAKNLLLNTDEPILSIALSCGFPVLSTFNRQFRQKTGMSPSQYRLTGNL